MPLIHVQKLHYSLPGKVIFDNVDFLLSHGDRTTIVGENGVGKSTFLRFLRAPDIDYDGIRAVHGEVGYLPQTFGDIPNISALEYVLVTAERPEWQAILAEDPDLRRWQELLPALGGHSIYQVLYQLNIAPTTLNQPMENLSGGEKTKIHLCALYHKDADILLLDEPTNNLDICGIEWLEGYLKNFHGGVVMVTHDRMLINNTAAHISELSPVTHQLKHFRGGYQNYLIEQEKEYNRASSIRATQEKELKVTAARLQKAHSSAKNPAARVRSDGDKLGFNARGQRRQKSMARAVGQLQTQLSLLQNSLHAVPPLRCTPAITLSSTANPQQLWIRGEAISHRFGNQHLFNDLSFSLEEGERLAITGGNGVGKTTLLNIIRGLSTPDTGKIEMSDGAKIGSLDQEQTTVDLSLSAREILSQANQRLSHEEMGHLLSKFGLYHKHDLQVPLTNLSIGLRRKVQLAAIVASGANILLLDEPTNHMDILSIEQIEEALIDFHGIIITVSHDRFFLKTLQAQIINITAPGSRR